MDNVLALHADLKHKMYRHGGYHAFDISDPKPRNIHKASVRDRLIHHAIYRILYPYFDQKFIADSYSCRLNKGTHKPLLRFASFARKVSQNNTKQGWVLKCDIRKFFASIDHNLLRYIVVTCIEDQDIKWLISEVIGSFSSAHPGKGLPLGNLTSQLLVNIYMNEFDQFVKHTLNVKYYIRFADDFVVFHYDKEALTELLSSMSNFLESNLKLSLHPDKVFIKSLSSGMDFLGWVHFPHHRVLRTATKKRMMKNFSTESASSYLGMLKWGNTHNLLRLLGYN